MTRLARLSLANRATVVTTYPGVSPEVMEQRVTGPIEAAVGGIRGVTGTHSTSTGGSSIVVVDLEYGADLGELTSSSSAPCKA